MGQINPSKLWLKIQLEIVNNKLTELNALK